MNNVNKHCKNRRKQQQNIHLQNNNLPLIDSFTCSSQTVISHHQRIGCKDKYLHRVLKPDVLDYDTQDRKGKKNKQLMSINKEILIGDRHLILAQSTLNKGFYQSHHISSKYYRSLPFSQLNNKCSVLTLSI